jgi:RND family efflux transporter MFP subunit
MPHLPFFSNCLSKFVHTKRAAWGFAALCLLPVLAACDPSAAQGKPPMAPPVSVAPAVQRQVQNQEEFSGRLEASETVDVRSRVAGTLDVVHFKPGQDVRRGQLLFTIDGRAFAAELARAQAQLSAARTASGLASSEQGRAHKLLAQRAISQQEFDQLSAGARSNSSAVKAAEAAVKMAQLNLQYSLIRSPIAGRISRNNVSVGNLVSAGDPVLTTVVSQNKVHAYFDVSEQSYLRLAPSLSARSQPEVGMGLSNENGFPHTGSIDFFDNRLNPATASVRVRAVFDNADRLFTPGLLARLRLSSGDANSVVMTPERAIGTDQSKRFVWVIGADNMPQFREVKLGALVDGMRVVSGGLKAGEQVVVNGLQRVRPGMPITPEVLAVDTQGLPLAAKRPAASAASSAAPAASKPE